MAQPIRIIFDGGKPLTKSFYAALGQVAQQSAALESALRELLANLMQSESGFVIAAGESLSNLLALCQRVAAFQHRLTDDQIETLNRIVQVIQPLQDLRNAVIHARWYPTDTARHFYGSRSRRPNPKNALGLSQDLYYTVDQICALADDLEKVVSIVDTFTQHVSGEGRLPSAVLSRQLMRAWSNFIPVHGAK